jgi:hypothetical protein
MISRIYVHTSVGGTKFEVPLSALSIITRHSNDSLLSHCKYDSSINVPTSKCQVSFQAENGSSQSEYMTGFLLLFQSINSGTRFHALNYGWMPLKDEEKIVI